MTSLGRKEEAGHDGRNARRNEGKNQGRDPGRNEERNAVARRPACYEAADYCCFVFCGDGAGRLGNDEPVELAVAGALWVQNDRLLAGGWVDGSEPVAVWGISRDGRAARPFALRTASLVSALGTNDAGRAGEVPRGNAWAVARRHVHRRLRREAECR